LEFSILLLLVVNGGLFILVTEWLGSRSLASGLRHEDRKEEKELGGVPTVSRTKRKEEEEESNNHTAAKKYTTNSEHRKDGRREGTTAARQEEVEEK
jgi:hypothetical protein